MRTLHNTLENYFKSFLSFSKLEIHKIDTIKIHSFFSDLLKKYETSIAMYILATILSTFKLIMQVTIKNKFSTFVHEENQKYVG